MVIIGWRARAARARLGHETAVSIEGYYLPTTVVLGGAAVAHPQAVATAWRVGRDRGRRRADDPAK